MKFTIKTEEIKNYIHMATSVTSNNSVQDASESILFILEGHTLTIRATDRIIFFQQKNIPFESKEPLEYEFLVDARLLNKDLTFTKSDILEFEIVKDRKLVMKEVGTHSVSEFMLDDIVRSPVYPEFDVPYEEMPIKQFQSSVRALIHFVSENDPQKSLRGIHFHADRAVAMNHKFGLYLKDLNTGDLETITLNPGVQKILKYMKKQETIQMYHDTEYHKLLFKDGDMYYGVSLVNRDFPFNEMAEKIHSVYGVYVGHITFDIQSLTEVINRLENFTDNLFYNFVHIQWNGEYLVFAQKKDIGGDYVESEINVESIDADPFHISMPLKALRSLTDITITDSVRLDIHDTKQGRRGDQLILCETLIQEEIKALVWSVFKEIKDKE